MNWNPNNSVAQDKNWILLSSVINTDSIHRLSSLGYVYKFMETYWLEGQRPAL